MTSPKTSLAGSIVVGTFRQRHRSGRVTFRRETKPTEHPLKPRPIRAAKMLALAHHFDDAIRAGTLEGPSDAGRRIGITESRVTQLLCLLGLAPDIQEDVLFLEVSAGREPFTESKLRKVSRVLSWTEQRRMYQRLRRDFEPRSAG